MKRKVAVCLGAISVVTWAAAPAAASDVGRACLGSDVAATAQFTQQELAMGFGAYFQLVSVNPGR